MTETPVSPSSHIGPSSAQQRSERERFVALAFCWGEFLMELDDAGVIVFAAGTAEAIIGQSPESLIGRSMSDIVAADDVALMEQLLAFARRRGRIAGVTLRLKKGSETVPLSAAGYRLEDLNGHFFFAFHRPSAQIPKGGDRDSDSELLTADAFVDALTDDNNVLAPGRHITLIGAEDYSGLRENMSASSEKLLQVQIGALLRANAVDGWAAARLDAGRYGLVHEDGMDVPALQNGIASLMRSAGLDVHDVAVGAVSVEVDEDVLRNPDVAKGLVYTINRFRTAEGDAFSLEGLSSKLSDLTSQAVAAVRDFSDLIKKSRFAVAFQPIVSARAGEIHHYEALARFDGDGGSSGPFQQILFAEETGQIVEFDMAMIAKVIEWLRSTPLTSKLQVAVNISGSSVGADGFASWLDAALFDSPWVRGRLMFEITESARMEKLGAANEFIQRLRRAGFPVCLDDFGAGAANFEYLARLEVDTVKLDGQALRNARKGPKGKAFLRALVNLCRELGVETIAEMIENERDIRFAQFCGIGYLQGYVFGQPAEDIAAFRNAIPRHLFRETA